MNAAVLIALAGLIVSIIGVEIVRDRHGSN